jgi:hypothetical protein
MHAPRQRQARADFLAVPQPSVPQVGMRVTRRFLRPHRWRTLVLTNLIADDTADYSTAHGPHGTPTSQYRPANRAGTSTNRGVLVSG